VSRMADVVVRFLADDPLALWKAGELAQDLGDESPGSPVRLLRVIRTGDLISLSRPYERNLIERVGEMKP
jgi:hypothetical protein